MVETRLLGQRSVFVRGGQAIGDLFAQSDAVQGWWPDSVRELLGPLSLANLNGADHKASRRVVGQLFASAALKRSSPSIVVPVNELSQELIASAAPMALVPKLRRFAFSVIASTVLGLDPEDREALFVDFETWCQGPLLASTRVARQPLRPCPPGPPTAAKAPGHCAQDQAGRHGFRSAPRRRRP